MRRAAEEPGRARRGGREQGSGTAEASDRPQARLAGEPHSRQALLELEERAHRCVTCSYLPRR